MYQRARPSIFRVLGFPGPSHASRKLAVVLPRLAVAALEFAWHVRCVHGTAGTGGESPRHADWVGRGHAAESGTLNRIGGFFSKAKLLGGARKLCIWGAEALPGFLVQAFGLSEGQPTWRDY